jgi:tRNA (guanine-N7-)-methyltransferase
MRKEENHIKSFVKRSGRLTNSQKIFLNNKNNDKNFFSANEILDFRNLFENNNKCILDIGFGDGKLLISLAKKFPELNFIGLEVYESGIGNILKQISNENLENIKISCADAIIFLTDYVENNSLYGISLFFPDPWPKKKHYKRRIIDESFINLISKKIYKGGFAKVATDWSNYSDYILEIFEKNNNFERTNNIKIFKNRCLTKFEKRGIKLGHRISELSYKLK